MRYTDTDLGVDITRAESERFGAPMLLLHGLWAGAWVWGRMAGYLGHRGWESWAPDRRAAGGRLVDRCGTIAREMPAPPVIVGHDLGAAVALRVARALAAPAVVLIAPLLPGSRGRRLAFGGLPRTVAAMVGRALTPPGDPVGRLLAECDDPVGRALIGTRLVDEDGQEVYDLLRGRVRVEEIGVLPPTLVIGGSRDTLVPEATIREMAGEIGGDSVILDGGHWLPIEATWQSTANCFHRWLVRTLGEPLLLLRGDENEDGEEDAGPH